MCTLNLGMCTLNLDIYTLPVALWDTFKFSIWLPRAQKIKNPEHLKQIQLVKGMYLNF